MKQKIELYPADAVTQRQRNNKIWYILTAAFAALSLAACIVLACRINTANAHPMTRLICLISMLAGWVVIFLCKHFVLPGKREVTHLRTVQDGEPESYTGEVTLVPGRIAIPGSIRVRSVFVQSGLNKQRLSINARLVRKLPKLPATLTLYAVHGYVVAYEEHHAAD